MSGGRGTRRWWEGVRLWGVGCGGVGGHLLSTNLEQEEQHDGNETHHQIPHPAQVANISQS